MTDRELLADLLDRAAAATDPGGAAPDEATLADYLAGDLTGADADRVRAWVVAHPAAADRLLELAPVVTATPSTDDVADLETRSAWRDLSRRLAAADDAAAPAVPADTAARRPTRWPTRRRWLTALAAVVVLALGFRVVQLEERLRRPLAATTTVALLGDARSDGRAAARAIVPGEPFLVTVFNPRELPAGCAAYDAVVSRDGGEVVAEKRGWLPAGDGHLYLTVRRGEPGKHVLDLEACGEPRGRLAFDLVAE